MTSDPEECELSPPMELGQEKQGALYLGYVTALPQQHRQEL
jgi:hypothetical protein